MKRRPEPERMDLPDEVAAYVAADFSDVNERFVGSVLELVADRTLAILRVVDLGCGPGDISIRLAAARPGWRVVALDASAHMLEAASRAACAAGLAGRIQIVRADAAATGLAHGSLDIIVSNSLLHHARSAGNLWAETRRLAAPGAAILFRDLARPATAKAASRIVARYAAGESDLLRKEYYRSLLAAYTPEEVRSQLDRAGLRGLDVAMVSDRHLDAFGRLP